MQDGFFTPVSGFDMPRFAGIPTFMRLPHVGLDHPRLSEVQIGLIGAPWDGGTTNRPGPRHGPRQLRDVSTMIRAQNGATWVAPFQAARCAGDAHRWALLPRLPAVIAAYHLGYGLGTWRGLWDLARGRRESGASAKITR